MDLIKSKKLIIDIYRTTFCQNINFHRRLEFRYFLSLTINWEKISWTNSNHSIDIIENSIKKGSILRQKFYLECYISHWNNSIRIMTLKDSITFLNHFHMLFRFTVKCLIYFIFDVRTCLWNCQNLSICTRQPSAVRFISVSVDICVTKIGWYAI